MNKIYKVVWSKALEAYVVTSELAKSHAKNSSRKGLRRGVTAALLAAMAVAPFSFGVYAAGDTHYVSVNSNNQSADSNYDNDGAKAKNSIAIGPSVETTGEDNIVIGSGEIVSQDKKNETSFDGKRVLVIGHGNYFQPTSEWDSVKGKSISYRDSAIIGHENKLLQGDKDDAGGGTPAYQIVHGWKNTLKGSFTGAIGYENEIKNSSRPGHTSQSMAFTIGTENTIDATGYYMGDKNRVNSLPDYKEPGENPNTVGADLYVIGRHNIIGSSKGGDWYVTSGHIIGTGNVIYSDSTNVFGENNKVYSGSGIAIGNANKVGIDNAGNLVKNKKGRAIYNPVAVGHGNIVTGNYGVALGVTAESRGEKATAVGSTAYALSDYSAALGSENRAKGYGSVAVGSLNNTYDFDNPGYKWVDFDSGDLSSAVGVQNISTGDYSSAVGYRNITDGQSASAFGYSNKAAEKYSFAAGAVNVAGGQFSSAVGGWNQAEGKKSQAVGYRNFVSGHGSVALGSENNLNFVKQYQALGFVQTGDLSSALGISNVTAGNMSAGIGNSNYAFGTKSVGVGLYNFSTGYETLAMGHYAIAGSEDLEKIDQVKYAAAIGNRAKSTINDAVAIGSFSNTTRDKGDYGYNPALGKAVTDTDITDDANIGTYRTELENARDAWQTSMEKAEELLHKIQTQQYANQAEYQQWGAEYEQLEADADAKLAAYDAAQKKVGDLVGAWQGQMAALSVGDEATGRTRQITGVAAGSADTDAVNVAQLKALNTKMDQGAIHYYSVTSDKKAAGSNYDNDGAKAADSMVIGIGSISEAQNSTVLGNNNTLKRYNADQNGSSSRNNIVAGQNLEVEGAYNAVFGTDYQNNLENRKTMAAGKYNTVIGVGNLAGYTAEKDPQDRNKWIYSKVEDGSDSQNVVVGINNTATRGSLVIGSESEATSSGISVGHHNKVVSDEDFGVALGNNLVVDGYQSVAIGSESEATANYATAIGQEAMAQADYTTAIGRGAIAKADYATAIGRGAVAGEKGSLALGRQANATTQYGVALGSYSIADRTKGAIGYLAGEETSEVWKATQGAVSVGNKEKKYTRQITGVAAGTEDTDAVNVAQLKAIDQKLAQGAVHYYSVTSDKKAAGSNFDNDGAKAADSMVIGIGSTSEVINSTVIGNNNTLKNTLKVGQRDRDGVMRNNSIVAGENIEVDGTRNAVFATDYKEGEHKLTKVAGKHNTVIGVGNLVGYTAKADPNNRNEFIYEKTDVTGSHDNVVVGMTNTVKGSSVVLGTNSEIKDGATLATSVGHANTIQGSDQYGLALGNKLLVEGYGAIAVGTESKATADDATAIGTEAVAEQEGSIAFGHAAEAKNKYSIAFGLFATAKARSGVAIGSSSLADREKGSIGYLAGENTSEVWKATKGAISVGNKEKKYTRQITGVAAGTEDTDAVNVAQLKAVQEIAAAKTTIEAGDNITVVPGTTAGSYKISATDTTLKADTNALSLDGSKLNLSVEDTKGNKVTGSVDLKSIQSAVDTNTYTTGGTYDAENKKLVFTQNDPSKNYEVDVSKMISDVVDTDTRNTIAETDTVAVDATDKNADGSVNYKLNVKTDGKVAKDDKGIVTGGTVYNETRIENDGNYIKAENTAGQNLIALDKQVDANTTNITKLENNIYDMGGRIGELGNRVDRVGAGAAALAALHPLDFDPDDKWDFAAGYGNYSGANAVAIGAYYRPNEDTMFSVGGSFGGGENMVNAGVSVKLGQGNNVSTSKVAMAKDMLDMQRRMAEMEAQMAKMQGFIGALTGMDAQAAMFPDVPENHWAYEYVKGLCEQGVIEGYPDGNFAGDRSMTRYELAAMLYRALSKGVSLDARAVKEFAPELARIRVDVVTKDKEGQPVIERVRVNEEKKEK